MAVNNNYISINGKKIPLTNEQVEQIKNLGITKDNPFERVKNGDSYYYIDFDGKVETIKSLNTTFSNNCFDTANYCTDRKLMEQRALHEILNRLLWRFSMTHGGDEIDWSKLTDKFYIYFDYTTSKYKIVASHKFRSFSEVYFKDEKTAKQAIDEIIKPFMKQHPEFVW